MKCLIYGATKGRGDGIGRSVAILLQKRGHEVRGLCRDPQKAGKETEFPIEALDLSTDSGDERLKAIIREFNPDAIWSACGAGFASPLWTMPITEIDQLIDANVRNNVLFSRICAPSCLDGGPHLILTGSIAGVLGETGAAVYSGVKCFLIPFARWQRLEYRRQGHNLKLTVLLLNAVRGTGLEVVADALEFAGRQSRSMEILIN